MYRKALIGGVTAAAILGAGGAAMAVTGSDSTPGQASSTATHAKHGKHAGDQDGRLLRRLEHGQFVVRGKDGKSTTVDLIKGTVTAVSSSSITVQSADKTSETFGVTSSTKVRVRQAKAKSTASTGSTATAAKPAAATIANVTKGDHVLVAGTGTSTLTATRVLDVKGARGAK